MDRSLDAKQVERVPKGREVRAHGRLAPVRLQRVENINRRKVRTAYTNGIGLWRIHLDTQIVVEAEAYCFDFANVVESHRVNDLERSRSKRRLPNSVIALSYGVPNAIRFAPR